MALKQSKLNKIPQRNKDLAFGYAKECEKEQKFTIPSMIKYLCLIYLHQSKDTFDPFNTHKEITIDGDTISTTSKNSVLTSLLENMVNLGVHIWRFKCMAIWACKDCIGITKSMKLKDGMSYLDYDGEEQVGYLFSAMGKVTNQHDSHNWGDEYGEKWGVGDVIEMKADFIKLELSFKVNKIDCGKAFDIHGGNYKATITMNTHYLKQAYQLISYQHTY